MTTLIDAAFPLLIGTGRTVIPIVFILILRVEIFLIWINQRVYNLLQTHLIATLGLRKFRIDPSFGVASSKIDDPKLILLVNHEIISLRISPYNLVLMQSLYNGFTVVCPFQAPLFCDIRVKELRQWLGI